jgi:hypothetical protein
MGDLLTMEDTAADLVPADDDLDFANALQEFADANRMSPIVGRLLRFNKGEYLYDQDGHPRELSEDAELVVSMRSLEYGWIKWVDKMIADRKMGLVAERFRAPARGTLDDNDQDLWPVDDRTGEAKDPWQLTFQLVMFDRTHNGSEGEGYYTFTTSSKGGRKAVADLAGNAKKHPGKNPVVKLTSTKYKHRKLGYDIKTPVFEIIGWE